MEEKEYNLYFWGLPFLGGIVGVIVSILFNNREISATAVMVGIASGYLALICELLHGIYERGKINK